MPNPETRVGYFTFEGLDGPRRLFYFDEPLALGLLCVLERAARSAGGDGTSGELDPALYDPTFLEAKRREHLAAEARPNPAVSLGAAYGRQLERDRELRAAIADRYANHVDPEGPHSAADERALLAIGDALDPAGDRE